MLLGMTATVAAACFCLGPTPAPETVPATPDAFTTQIHDQVPADAIPVRCLSSEEAWSRLGAGCPRMPADPFVHAGARPMLLYRVR